MKRLILGWLIFATPAFAAPTQITLTWMPGDSNQKGFKLYSGVTGNESTNVIDVGNVITYTGTFELGATPLCFTVSAYNSVGESKRSLPACAKVPAAPSSVKQVQ